LKDTKKVLSKTRSKKYNLTKEELEDMLKKLYLELGFFKIIQNNNKEGRRYLTKAFKIKNIKNINYEKKKLSHADLEKVKKSAMI